MGPPIRRAYYAENLPSGVGFGALDFEHSEARLEMLQGSQSHLLYGSGISAIT